MNPSLTTFPETANEEGAAFRIGSAVIWRRTGVIERGNCIDKLRRKELDLVTYLYANATRVVTRDELLSNVWKCSVVYTRTIDQTVATLRRKLGEGAAQVLHLVTVHRSGYILFPNAPQRANQLKAA